MQHPPALPWLTGELVFTCMSEKEVSGAPLCLRVRRELWGLLLFPRLISACPWKVIKQKHMYSTRHGSFKKAVKVCFINRIHSGDYKQMCSKFKWNELFSSNNPFLPRMHNILDSSCIWFRTISSRTKIRTNRYEALMLYVHRTIYHYRYCYYDITLIPLT